MNTPIMLLIIALILAACPVYGKGRGGGTTTLSDLDCDTNQIAKFDGEEWKCAEDETGLHGQPFNYVLVDFDTGEQVGVYMPGSAVFKIDLFDGRSVGRYSPVTHPGELPSVNTQVEVKTLFLRSVGAYYRCDDGSLLGWWSGYDSGSRLPREYFTTTTPEEFGALPNGDVVLAIATNENSVQWNGDYSGIVPLDPDAPEDQSNPNWVEFDLECFFAAYADLGLGPDSDGDGEQDAGSSPFNMTWETTLADIANNAYDSADEGPVYSVPYIYYTSNYVGGDPNPGNPLVDQLIADCLTLSDAPQEFGHCELQFQGDSPARLEFIQSPILKSASYTKTDSVTSVEPVGAVPGNRGEPRTFVEAWR